MAKNEIPGMRTGCRVMSKVVDTVVGLAILVIVIKTEDSPCRENETDNPRPSEAVIPITHNRPINLERNHQIINDTIDPQEWACRCGLRATRRGGLTQCRKCRRWHRHQDGLRRHRRGEQW